MIKKGSILILSTLIIGVLIAAGCMQIGGGSMYSFKSAKIIYTYSGVTEGEEYLYIQDDKQASYKTITEAGVQKEALDLILGDTKYYVDLNENTALKSTNKAAGDTKGMSKEEKDEYLLRKALNLNDTAEIPEPLGKTSYADTECSLYPTGLGAVCVWDGLVLYQEASLGGVTTTKKATKVEVGIDIPKEKFDLPDGVDVKGE